MSRFISSRGPVLEQMQAADRHRHRHRRGQPVPHRGRGRGRPRRHRAHGAAQGRARGRGRDDPRGRAPGARCERAWAGRDRGRGRGVAGRAQRDPRQGHLHARHPRPGRRRPARGDRGPGGGVCHARRAPPCPDQGREVLRRARRHLRPASGRGAGGGRRPRRRSRPHRLPSGAGHDGLAIAALCPIAMLFVRCKGGISHNPAESITTRDADVGDARPARLPAPLSRGAADVATAVAA